MASRIEDYALIGDCETAALIGRDGSIDWLCFPRFDSAACFASLLGTAENGRWLVAPAEPILETHRSYQGDTLVLETIHRTAGGKVKVIDFMPIRSKQPDLARLVVGVEGRVRMRTELIIRFDYGSATPWVRREEGGLVATAGPDTLHLRSPVQLHGEGWKTVGEFEVAAGQELPFVLTWHPSHLPRPRPIDPLIAHECTVDFWKEWSSRCRYQGEYREAVLRSLITLKALTYAPTGGIVAAPTTSLPEHIGGVRNWDYRYCWLRDATFTLMALLQSGYLDEASAWREWLLRAVAGRGSELQIMYGLAGERRLTELELPWLIGYEGSRPVRIGNGAFGQFQLDVFGEVLDCLHLARHFGIHPEAHAWHIEREMLHRLESLWPEPDEGIWEIRGPKQHFTHSKVMAWVAFDRAVKDAERFGFEGPVDDWKRQRDELHAQICDQGFDRELNSFVQGYGGRELDASLLILAEVGFLPAKDPRILGTIKAIEKTLVRDGFVDRYHTHTGVDGLPRGEGAFLLCTFWLADNYAMAGRVNDARETFERLLAIRSDVGLLAEEYDPIDRRQLGNYPQAFSHLGLINTARNLSNQEKPTDVRAKA